MRKFNVFSLPAAEKVGGQALHEIEENAHWSAAHVTMEPKAEALLHKHESFDELYVITRGTGMLTRWPERLLVREGDAVFIPYGVPHRLVNTDAHAPLEHLVLATPPLDLEDVHEVPASCEPDTEPTDFRRPPFEKSFDGADVVCYRLGTAASVALGIVPTPLQQTKRHYHEKRAEHVYVVRGRGTLLLNGSRIPLRHGDWLEIEPRGRHAFCADPDEWLAIVCITTPPLGMNDVYFD